LVLVLELDHRRKIETEGRKDRKGLTPILLTDLCGLLFVSSKVAFEFEDETTEFVRQVF